MTATSAKPATDPAQQLPSKEGAAFKSILRFYELKQYKKAIKTADGILKKFPDNGETLAMKGLALSAVNRKEEAYELVRKGLRLNLRSHICWHVYGLVYRTDQNYTEAIKCYQNALKFEPENQQILRDLALLQMQTRDLKGLQKTRRVLLSLGATHRNNWFGFSLSHHLSGNYKMAIAICDSYYGTLKTDGEQASYEESEMIMYKAMLLEESGAIEECLSFLIDKESRILDVVALNEKKAELSLRLLKYEEARKLYEKLIESNPENYIYHRGFQASLLGVTTWQGLQGCELPINFMTLNDQQREMLMNIYDEFHRKQPKIWAFRRIPFDFVVGSEFKTRVGLFLCDSLKKGLPSLFAFFKPIYKIAMFTEREKQEIASKVHPSDAAISAAKEKVLIIEETALNMLQSLRATSTFPKELDTTNEAQAPTVYLWALYFLAQHYDTLGYQAKALELIDEAIENTPTLVDLYQVKGLILKHMGDLDSAADLIEIGRNLDLADRNMNTKATKYFLRALKDSKADEVISLFTKHEGDSRTNLFEMQCMWYEVEAGNSALRQRQIAKALKFFTSIEKHFKDFVEDQFDFHSYCLRKMTLRAYMDLLRYEDDIRSHRFFTLGAHGSVTCYLQMHDIPKEFSDESEDNEDLSNMSAAERKKVKQRARKAAAAKAKVEEEKKEQEKKKEEENAKDGKKRLKKLPVDTDPDGTIAFTEALKDPLKFAYELVKQTNKQEVQCQVDFFDVQVRRKKYLRALAALKQAASLTPLGIEHPDIHSRLVPLISFIKTGRIRFAPWASVSTSRKDYGKPVDISMTIHPESAKVIDHVIMSLYNTSDAQKIADDYLKKWRDTKQTYRKLAAIKAMLLMNPEKQVALLEDLIKITSQDTNVEAVSAVHDFISTFSLDSKIVENHKLECRRRFPSSKAFL